MNWFQVKIQRSQSESVPGHNSNESGRFVRWKVFRGETAREGRGRRGISTVLVKHEKIIINTFTVVLFINSLGKLYI